MTGETDLVSCIVPDNKSPLNEWLAYLEQTHPNEIELGLERVDQVLQRAGLQRPARFVITVAGTNGKGSTVAYLDTILRASGYKVGVYTSPHLVHYNERVSINGEWLSDADHVQAFAAIEQYRQKTSLTYFEFGTLAAFWLMKQQPLDVAILEVGLGGRLDAVNVVDPDIAVITSIGIDHIQFLGDNRELIGREKAGIARSDTPLICGDSNPPKSIRQYATEINAILHQVGNGFSFNEQPKEWHYRGIESNLLQLPLPRLPLMNAATALAALECLPLAVSADAIKLGLRNAELAGRMQQRHHQGCDILLDVAHNAHAAGYLVKVLKKLAKQRPVYAVVGMLKDKDHNAVFETLNGVIDHWYLGTLTESRGNTATVLAAAPALNDKQQLVDCYDTIESAFESALTVAQNSSDDEKPLVFVFGSFYTVGSVNHYLRS